MNAMSQLLIEIDSPEDEILIRQLLNRLNVRLVDKNSLDERKKRFREALDNLVASGAAETFGDPSEWQRETRMDRELDGRNE
jgi:hypothetical protein